MDFEKIPYVVYESAQTRSDRTIKRLIVALIIVTAMLFVSNVIWLHKWTEYDYADTNSELVVRTDGEGDANYIGNDGDITNGFDIHP